MSRQNAQRAAMTIGAAILAVAALAIVMAPLDSTAGGATPPANGSTCTADLSGDGSVGTPDLLQLLGAWGPCAACAEDINDDGAVDVIDLLMVLSQWSCTAGGLPACHVDAGDCCAENGTPGCEDAECCEAICAADPFCCNETWDVICANQAIDECDGCLLAVCGPGAGNCTIANGTPGCNDEDCCGAVCIIDPFCCNETWDAVCADIATEQCDFVSCSGGAGDCCVANGSPGCEDVTCCEAVCACDPFCCEAEWDSFCAGQGFDPDCLCGPGMCGAQNTFECDCPSPSICPDTAAGDCCQENGTPGCHDPQCCEAICECDPYCCEVEWDCECALINSRVPGCSAIMNPNCTCDWPPTDCDGNCLPGLSGDCCSANGTPGCDDVECCSTVCGIDPFCCDVAWDGVCAEHANAQCAACAPSPCGQPGSGDCFVANGIPGCEDVPCCEAVCECDPFCCNVEWDSFCAGTGFDPDCLCGPGQCGALNTPECDCLLAPITCTPLCDNTVGDCCSANGTIGCEDGACCSAICSFDPFCCDVQWDAICADLAIEQCDICQPIGEEGCSIGFWKQPQHFQYWNSYEPDDLFTIAFGIDAFPGATLHDVLTQRASAAPGPPQLSNLGRHSVAALLNAASNVVAYAYITSDVIDMFNDAYVEFLATGNHEVLIALKDELEQANTAGCPLPPDMDGSNEMTTAGSALPADTTE